MLFRSNYGKSWVKCEICGFAARSLGKHLSSSHGLRKGGYLLRFPEALIKCEDTSALYSEQNSLNGDWISRRKKNGESLKEYSEKMSEAVSKSIMNNEVERSRRSQQLAKNNRTLESRERSSRTARITSSRPEILQNRSENLRRWRDENPEKFELIVTRLLTTRISRPEKVLHDLLKDFDLRRQVTVQHDSSPTTTKKLRVDLGCLKRKILIEFDGPFHFKPIMGLDRLEYRRRRDKSLENYAVENEMTLIRIAQSEWIKGRFRDSCMKEVIAILENPIPGIYYFGEEYADGKHDRRPHALAGDDGNGHRDSRQDSP